MRLEYTDNGLTIYLTKEEEKGLRDNIESLATHNLLSREKCYILMELQKELIK